MDITNTPTSDRITRERTFTIVVSRDDRKDALAQLAITIDELVQKGFTGKIILNCNGSGVVDSVQVLESHKM